MTVLSSPACHTYIVRITSIKSCITISKSFDVSRISCHSWLVLVDSCILAIVYSYADCLLFLLDAPILLSQQLSTPSIRRAWRRSAGPKRKINARRFPSPLWRGRWSVTTRATNRGTKQHFSANLFLPDNDSSPRNYPKSNVVNSHRFARIVPYGDTRLVIYSPVASLFFFFLERAMVEPVLPHKKKEKRCVHPWHYRGTRLIPYHSDPKYNDRVYINIESKRSLYFGTELWSEIKEPFVH